jgi:RNA polymerase sigma-70 factor, ECF subfamily
MENLADEELVRMYQKTKDQKFFEILTQRHLGALYNFVFKYIHTIAETEDVTQETFLKIWKNIHKFDNRFKFKTWAYTIAKNTALDALKKKGLIPFSAMNEEEEKTLFNSLTDKNPLPEEVLGQIEDMEIISRAIEQIPEDYQKIIKMYYFEGLNLRQASEKMKKSINTVKTRHRRALMYLKKLIKEN